MVRSGRTPRAAQLVRHRERSAHAHREAERCRPLRRAERNRIPRRCSRARTPVHERWQRTAPSGRLPTTRGTASTSSPIERMPSTNEATLNRIERSLRAGSCRSTTSSAVSCPAASICAMRLSICRRRCASVSIDCSTSARRIKSMPRSSDAGSSSVRTRPICSRLKPRSLSTRIRLSRGSWEAL